MVLKESINSYISLKRIGSVFFILITTFFNSVSQIPSRCGTNSIHYSSELEGFIQQWITENEAQIAFRNEKSIIIPVVVHVVWNQPKENICTEQIISQIEVLNEDFNRKNSNINSVPEEFSNLITDTQIEFCLASLDPDENLTNGITRTKTTIKRIGTTDKVFYSSKGGKDAWDTKSYLNIWIADTGESIPGYASAQEDINTEKDGIVINSKYFGRTGTAKTSRPFHLGRTATHEIGHYLGLLHPWGVERDDCEEDDLIGDTPIQSNPYRGCPPYPQFSCNSNDLVVNFMDLVDDQCMAMFTKMQKNRMLAVLNTIRKGLLISNALDSTNIQSNKPFDLSIFPNPANRYLNIVIDAPNQKDFFVQIVDLFGKIQYSTLQQANIPNLICIDHLANGFYCVYIKVEDQIVTKKIIITKKQ